MEAVIVIIPLLFIPMRKVNVLGIIRKMMLGI